MDRKTSAWILGALIGIFGLGPQMGSWASDADLTEKPVSGQMFEERRVPLENEDLIASAGFVVPQFQAAGEIQGVKEPREGTMIAKGQVVLLQLTGSDKPAVGESLSIVQAEKKVTHPVRKKSVGTLVEVLGEASVSKTEDDRAEAVVTRVYRPIEPGNQVIRKPVKDVPMIDPDQPVPSKEISGYIVAAKGKKMDLGKDDVVYLDVGSDQGVLVGDHFQVRQGGKRLTKSERKPGMEKNPVGEVVVLLVLPTTSTGLIVKSPTSVLIGDEVQYVENR